jgi:hypothetical protein
VAFALLLVAAVVHRVDAGELEPLWHGFLDVKPVRGTITNLDRMTANLNVRGWLFLPSPDSNGIFPTQEDVIIAIGGPPRENVLTVPRGLVRANPTNTRFSYRGQVAAGTRGVRSVRIRRKPDKSPLKGWYSVEFKVRGLDLLDLYDQDPVCVPIAFIIGDDDGTPSSGPTVLGIELTRKNFESKRFRVRGLCDSGQAWPWL